MQYAEDGYCRGSGHYLARLGWSHGDEEMFTVEQFLQWFDLAHISRSAAHSIPRSCAGSTTSISGSARDAISPSSLLRHRARRRDLAAGPELAGVVALLKERSETLAALAAEAMMFYIEPAAARDAVTAEVRPALSEAAAALRLSQTGARKPSWARSRR